MTKQSDHYRAVPKSIFVVMTDKSYRIYTAEGHALNWYNKQATKGLHPKLIKYEAVQDQASIPQPQ